MRTKTTAACALTAFIAAAGGTAEATGLIHTADIAKGAVTLNRLALTACPARPARPAWRA